MLEYVDGGENAAILGAWDFVSANAQKEMPEDLIGRYKGGKYVEHHVR